MENKYSGDFCAIQTNRLREMNCRTNKDKPASTQQTPSHANLRIRLSTTRLPNLMNQKRGALDFAGIRGAQILYHFSLPIEDWPEVFIECDGRTFKPRGSSFEQQLLGLLMLAGHHVPRWVPLDEYGVAEDFTSAVKNVSELIRQEQFDRKSLSFIKEWQLFRSLCAECIRLLTESGYAFLPIGFNGPFHIRLLH